MPRTHRKVYRGLDKAMEIAWLDLFIGSKSLYWNIPYGAKTVFTRSAITAESEPIWMNKVHQMWGVVLADFGRHPRSSDSLKGIVFPKNAKIAHKISRSCDFRSS